MRSYTESELAWMVGNFDGEGSIYHGQSQPHRRKMRPYLTLSSTDEWIIDRWLDLAGGRKNGPYRYQDHHKPFWYWVLTGDASLELAQAMLPFLCPRRQEQMQVIFDYVPRKTGRPAKDHETPCSEEGCEAPAIARTLCSKHYQRVTRGKLR